MKKLLGVLAVGVALCVFMGPIGCGQPTTKKGPKVTDKDEKKELTVQAENVTVDAGKSAKVKVSVTRKGFEDEVSVKFSDLPEGVSVEGGAEQKIAKGVEEKEFTLKADDTVKDAKTKASVVATFEKMKPSASFEITTKAGAAKKGNGDGKKGDGDGKKGDGDKKNSRLNISPLHRDRFLAIEQSGTVSRRLEAARI